MYIKLSVWFNRVFLYSLCNVCMIQCSQNNLQILPEEKFSHILTDFYVMKNQSTTFIITSKIQPLEIEKLLYQICQQHNVTTNQFYQSYTAYSKDLQKLMILYEKVIQDLRVKQEFLKENNSNL